MTRSPALRAAGLVLAAAFVTVTAAAAGYLTWRLTSPAVSSSTSDADAMATAALGVDFELGNQHGGITRLSDLRGDAVLMFFGYTHCPDICPGTLFAMSSARELLGARAERLQGVLITVDPARDTPERLRAYLAHFDASFLGLSGTDAELATVARAFGAAFEKGEVDGSGGYLMGHSTFAYLLDTNGKVVKLYPPDATPEELVKGVNAVLDKAG